MGSAANSGRNVDDDLFGKGPGSNGDQSLNMSSKIDERTSLLPDGSRAKKPDDQGAKIAPSGDGD